MSTDDTYNGYTNRETWAVALYINNDQGWQEQVFEALREATIEDRPANLRYGNAELDAKDDAAWRARQAGEIIKENVEHVLSGATYGVEYGSVTPNEALAFVQNVLPAINDIGSLHRVNWDELGANFLEDLKELA